MKNERTGFSENGNYEAVPAFDTPEEEWEEVKEEQERKEKEAKRRPPVFSENGEPQ